MRFDGADWLRLILACIAASAAMAAVSWASWSMIGFPRVLMVHAQVALALSLLATPLNALAAWPVLRRCVNDLELRPWHSETALGAVLGGLVSAPAMVALMLGAAGDFPAAPALPSLPVGWLPPVASAVAALLPPGLLLQRLSGARAWPALAVIAVSMVVVPLMWSGQAMPLLVPYTMMVAHAFLPASLAFSATVANVVISGLFSGVTLGTGLYLMARERLPSET